MNREHRRATWLALAGAGVMATACAAPNPGEPSEGPLAVPEGEEVGVSQQLAGLDDVFAAAADEFDVPVGLLKVIGHVETGWQMVQGDEEFEGLAPRFGLMALGGERLTEGAALADVDLEQVQVDVEANVRAAAALLSARADELGVARDDLSAWAPAVAAFSGIDDEEARAEYVTARIYPLLSRGFSVEFEGGYTMAVAAQPAARSSLTYRAIAPQAAVDFPGALWRSSPNHSSRPAGDAGKVSMVIIHTCEGNYSGCWSWLRNSAAGASAHYVVNESGSEVTQLVRESRRAWHIAASYACSRNGSVQCARNGQSSNNFTVGIEHGGFASQRSFPAGQIDKSAKLTCDITRRHGIVRDRFHIVAHAQLQPHNRTDPGPNWPWSHYLERVRAHCGEGDGPGDGDALIIDSNNARNDRALGYLEVSDSWVPTDKSPGYYGTGYYWAATDAVSDGATFYVHAKTDQRKTLDAWWTAGANRTSQAGFVVFDASGQRQGSALLDQRTNGNRWVTVGTFQLKAGWNRVVVSRWAPKGSVVVADAIRVR